VPAETSFAIVGRSRPFALVSPGFEQTGADPAPMTSVRHTGISPAAPFAAVEVDVLDASSETTAGLLTVEGNGVRVDLDAGRRRLRIVVVRDGLERTVRRARVRDRLRRMAFVLCENRVTAVVDAGSGWQAVASERDRVARALDLRDPATLAAHAYAWGPTSGSAALGRVRAGPFGMVGVRDPHLVQHADGRPYLRDGRYFLTMTCAGMGFFTQAHWGVFTLDPSAPEQLTQVAHLFWHRDGLVLGDHAGQVIVDGDTARVVVSSWGDFDPETGVHLRYAECGLDVLAGVHVLDSARLAAPTAHSAWDPSATRIDGRWHLAFVESPSQSPFDFHPALAAGPPGGAWGDRLELVGADTSLDQCEGPVLARLEGRWRLLASDGRARRYPVYDLEMQPVGSLPAPYGTNIPHPQLLAQPAGSAPGAPTGTGTGTELLLTFDGSPWCTRVLGYGTHGDFIVMAR